MNDRVDTETGEITVREEGVRQGRGVSPADHLMDGALVEQRLPDVFSITPRNLAEALELAKWMADSELVPKDYRGKPANCLIAMQMGGEIGLKPMQAIQGIAIINGRPGVFGDAMWALVRSHPLCQAVAENYNASTQTATCMVQRRGSEPTVRTFSQADAVKARLWGKEGPWTQYPLRMLQWRARGYAARDAIPEALKGVPLASDLYGADEKDVTPGQDERLQIEMQIRGATSAEGLKLLYEGLTSEDQVRFTGLVAEMKRKLAGAAKQDKVIETEALPVAPGISDVRSLLRKGDLDGAADVANSISDEVLRKAALDEVNAAAAAGAKIK